MGEIYRPCFTREQAHMHSFSSAKPSTLSPQLKTKQKQTKHTHTHQTNKQTQTVVLYLPICSSSMACFADNLE